MGNIVEISGLLSKSRVRQNSQRRIQGYLKDRKMFVINVQDSKSRKANRQMKQIFKTLNVLEIVRLDAHLSSLSVQEERPPKPNSKKPKRVVFSYKTSKAVNPLEYNSESL